MKKTALVTGGAKGIGAAIVKKLCEDGFTVAVNYLNSEQRANALCSELIASGYDAFPVRCDVSSAHEVSDMFSYIREKSGDVDVLVNNAGISHWGLFQDVTDSEWNAVCDINLKGTFNCCREAIPAMIKNGNGRIINISSVWGQQGASCEVIYSASKAGIAGLTKALAKETALSGITVNCVCPGVIETDMMNRFLKEEKNAICEEIPMGRMGTPDDVAQAVSFFSSEKSSYVTGQIIGVNGGMV